MAISTIGTNSLASTAQIGSLTTASGSAPSYSARAWVNFNGTGTVAIRASGNVSSITDSGLGLYVVNFTTALQDANYSATFNADDNSGNNPQFVTFRSATASALSIGTWQSAVGRADIANVSVAVFR